MIDFTKGNVLAAETDALVNTVNCVGVMGRGVALQFKKSYPANYEAYKAACERGEVQPGRMFVFETGQLGSPRYIINFPTKRHWRGKSRIEDIEAGLDSLVKTIRELGIQSVAVPPLGSGLGGLDWRDVRPRLERALGGLSDVHVLIYEPHDAATPVPDVKVPVAPQMTPGRAALVGLMSRYLAGLMDPSVTLLEVHKLMYFMQEAGERLKLRYKPAIYGPYAENLRHVLQEIEGYFVTGYAHGGDAPDKELQLVPGAVDDAVKFLKDNEATRQRFDRVAELVEGFETGYGLELLSTVHWVVTKGKATSPDEVIAKTYAWGPRKRQFTEEQIGLARDVLVEKGWIPGFQGNAKN